MISSQEALRLLQDTFHQQVYSSESVQTEDAYGRILAENIIADRDYPPFHRVMMDGYAIRYQDYIQGVRNYNCIGEQAAGNLFEAPTQTGQAPTIEIMTGAVLPKTFDMIIPYEDSTRDGFNVHFSIEADKQKYAFVHQQGTDCKKGDVILQQGLKLHAGHIGIATSFGCVVQMSMRFLLHFVHTDTNMLNIYIFEIKKTQSSQCIESKFNTMILLFSVVQSPKENTILFLEHCKAAVSKFFFTVCLNDQVNLYTLPLIQFKKNIFLVYQVIHFHLYSVCIATF
jgi:hypothetical protein